MEAKPTTENSKTQQRHNRRPGQDYRNDGRTRNVNYSNNQQIFIGNLSNNISKEELKEHFERYGAVIEVSIKKNADGSQSKFGFVIFKDTETVRVVLDNKVSFENNI